MVRVIYPVVEVTTPEDVVMILNLLSLEKVNCELIIATGGHQPQWPTQFTNYRFESWGSRKWEKGDLNILVQENLCIRTPTLLKRAFSVMYWKCLFLSLTLLWPAARWAHTKHIELPCRLNLPGIKLISFTVNSITFREISNNFSAKTFILYLLK